MNGGEGIISYGTSDTNPGGSALFEQNVSYDNWSVNMYFDNNSANLSGTKVYNNLMAGYRIGILDYAEGQAHAALYHGLRDNTSPSGINRNSNSFIQNNLIIGFSDAPLILVPTVGTLTGITLNNNLYYSPVANLHKSRRTKCVQRPPAGECQCHSGNRYHPL